MFSSNLRKVISAVFAAFAGFAAASIAQAQYIILRIIANEFHPRLGATVVVENMVGAADRLTMLNRFKSQWTPVIQQTNFKFD